MLKFNEIQKKVIPIAKKYDVTHMEVFGSYASGTANTGSDIDFLVKFSVPVPSIFKVLGFREELKNTLGLEVDVVTLPLTNPKELFIEGSVKIL